MSSFLTVFFTLTQAAAPNIAVIIILRLSNGIIGKISQRIVKTKLKYIFSYAISLLKKYFNFETVGFFGPLAITLIAEITPSEVRGKFMSLITVSFSIGKLYGYGVGYFTLNGLNSGNWRAMILWTGLPGAIAWVVAIIFLEESARFDIIDG